MPSGGGNCSTGGEDGPARQDGMDGVVGVYPVPGGGADDRLEGGAQVRPPGGAEAAGDLAAHHHRPKITLAAVVVRRRVGVLKKGEQAVAHRCGLRLRKRRPQRWLGCSAKTRSSSRSRRRRYSSRVLAFRACRRRASTTARSSSPFGRGAKTAPPASTA